MSLHAELTGDRVGGCKLCAFLLRIPADEQQEWQAELRMPVGIIGNKAVVNALQRRGTNITEASVRRHREHHT